MKGWKKIFHANRDQNKAGVAILISDKIGFKTKAVKKDKEGHYIMIKGFNNNTIIVGDFNTPFTPKDRSTKQKINKETQTLNDTMDQLDLIDICRTFHPRTMNFTFFSSAHRTFSRTDHILGHKYRLGKFKTLKSFQASFLITIWKD